jgi:hypothetical protein
VVTALDASVAVGRNEREGVNGGSLDDIRDDVCRLVGQVAQAVPLPGGDDRPRGAYVGDGGARGGEREPPAGALEAAAHGPGGGRAAPGAARAAEPAELRATTVADRRAQAAASRAPTWNQKIEQHIRSTVRGEDARVGAETASNV